MAQFEDASPICRGKNLSWETVLLFYNNMPREAMPKAQFHLYTEAKINGWTQTHSQIARQLAFYYEKDGICYPRFTSEISYSILFEYMQNWSAKYFVPNPYTPSLKDYTPTCIYADILNAIKSGENDFDKILDSMFGVALSSHDKVRVYLSNFTDLIIDDNKVIINKRTLGIRTLLNPEGSCAIDVKKYFDYFSINSNDAIYSRHPFTLQRIFYGAPGTGKSKTIKNTTEEAEKDGRVFRTTFHPDSDYSTFVGCYKPTKVKSFKQPRMDMSLDDLAKALGSYYKNEELGKIGGLQQFCLEYYPYIDGEYMSVNVTKLIELAGVPKDYNVEVNKYIKFIHLLPHHDPDKITYEFIPQAFTIAYVKAWNTEEDVYLIIEEINRGNCAQIFGDLFQLLDRKDGVSEYPIDADTDLANYLSKKLAGSTHKDITDEIREGKKLKLPSNLYIWATMNTSDQSLFPIDSAFKRRWDWKYMKIRNHPEENYKIKLSDKEYDWWEFIQRINEIIASMTSSADKQLGYFFCKATEGNNINPETFVSKVIFYLWNDVFKDYGFEDESLFSYKEIVEGKEERKELTFPDFYDEDGEKVNEVRLKGFLDSVMNWKKDEESK